jgi:predicted glycoside hydrolase/deacetylase ChbG (UPF0249 family)
MAATRHLVVIADDYGIGPDTSRGIRELAARGVVTGTVLLVNSPHAEEAVRAWRRAGNVPEMGWHPNLTLDAPLSPLSRVPSLVGPDGRFWPLGRFLSRLVLGRVRAAEVEIELVAQYRRFLDLIGRPPALVNAHQHVALFPPVGTLLLRLLAGQRPLPLVRRVREPWLMLHAIPGAKIKRTLLTLLGLRLSARQERMGFPGADWLAGITDPPFVADPAFFVRWLTRVPGRVVELACHPGHPDPTLYGRDCTPTDGLFQRRVDEMGLLQRPEFAEAVRRAGFILVSPSALVSRAPQGVPPYAA